MRGDRLFAILYLLAERKSMTAQELAEKLEVSLRTVYRDIQALSVWGAPIRTEPGPGGGVSLMEGGALDKALLTAQQQRQVLMALENFSVAGGQGEEVLDRLRSFFGQPEQSWIEADFSCWGGGSDRGLFELLRQAVLERREISFDYLDREGRASRRRVRPAKLVFKTSAWYVQAFCLSRQAWRAFKIRRMSNLALEEERFPPLSPPPLEPPPQAVPMTTLWFAPEHWSRVREEFEPGQIRRLPSGGFLIRAPLPADDWLSGYLLSFGGGVLALDPPCLEEQMLQKAARILAKPENLSEILCEIADIQLSAMPAYHITMAQDAGKEQDDMEQNKNYEDMKFCQSCGMPLTEEGQLGTNADGSLNQDYCSYCWKQGAFTWPEATMEQMLDHCAPMMAQSGFTEEEDRRRMGEWFPMLKRWKQ